MKEIETIYFVESGKIHPFIKIKDTDNKEYYQMKEIKENKEIDIQEKENLLLNIKIQRYINFLIKGYTYEELHDSLNKALEFTTIRRNYNGIKEIHEEKESLDLATNLYLEKKNTKKRIRINN